MNTEAVLEANKNLNKKISKLEKEIERLWHFEEMFKQEYAINEKLQKQLNLKRNVIRIIQKKENINYVLQILKIEDTPEGLFIEVT